jgi:predicted transcriptional regulator
MDVKRISRTIQTDSTLREILIEFFIGGRNSRIGTEIPLSIIYAILNCSTKNLLPTLRVTNTLKEFLNDNETKGNILMKSKAHVLKRIIQSRLESYKRDT